MRLPSNSFETTSALAERKEQPSSITPMQDHASKGYALYTESDLGCKTWRLWQKKHLKSSVLFGPSSNLGWIPPSQQVDRYEAHAKNCVSCSGALKNARLIDKFAVIIAFLPFVLSQSLPARLAGIALFGIIKICAGKVIRAILGPERGEATSAAQFPS